MRLKPKTWATALAFLASSQALAQTENHRCELLIPINGEEAYWYGLDVTLDRSEQGEIQGVQQARLDLALTEAGVVTHTYLTGASLDVVSVSERFALLDYPNALEKLSLRVSADASGALRAIVYHAHTSLRGLEASESVACSFN